MPPGRVGFVLRGRGVRLIRGVGFKSPFPWGAFYALDDVYLELGSRGAVAVRPGRKRQPVYLDYSAIKAVTVRDNKLLVDDQPVLVAPSAKVAERLRRDLEAALRLPEKKRLEAAKKLFMAQIDPEAARARRSADDAALVDLRCLATSVLAVVAAIIVYLLLGRTELLMPMLIAACVLVLVTIVRFVMLHAELWPKDRAQRWTRAFTYAYPLALARCSDVCTQDGMADLHLLAAMRAFTTAADAGRVIESTLADARAAAATLGSDLERTRAEHRANLVALLEAIAPAPEAAKPAVGDDEGIVVRCPRCGAGYTRQVTECFDCGAAIERVG